MAKKKKKSSKENAATPSHVSASPGRNKNGINSLRNSNIKTDFWTFAQEDLYNTILKKTVTFASGPAGTGKTYIATLAALMILKDSKRKIKKIYITKPLIEAGENLGFLPGNVENKVDPFMFSFYKIIEKIAGKGTADTMLKDKTIEVMPLAYMRGITLDNCVAILDETQNATPVQVKMFLSRLGRNAKMVVAGDEKQSDRRQNQNGLSDALDKCAGIDPQVDLVEFEKDDIIRHSLVTKILEAYEE